VGHRHVSDCVHDASPRAPLPLHRCPSDPCASNPWVSNPWVSNPCPSNPCPSNPCPSNPWVSNPWASNPWASGRRNANPPTAVGKSEPKASFGGSIRRALAQFLSIENADQVDARHRASSTPRAARVEPSPKAEENAWVLRGVTPQWRDVRGGALEGAPNPACDARSFRAPVMPQESAVNRLSSNGPTSAR